MENIKAQFKKDEILLFYKCGSHAFGTTTEISDEDYVVVLRDFKGTTHRSFGKKEYFIFGIDDWKAKEEFSDDFDEYFLMFNDEVLAFPESIIYAHESIKELTEKYRTEFPSKCKLWLSKVISHYRFYFGIGDVNKSMYHLIRIKHIIENYKSSGVISLELSKEVSDWILKFKRAENKKEYKNDLYDALVFLEKQLEVL